MPLSSLEAQRAFERVMSRGYRVVAGPFPDELHIDHYSRQVSLSLKRGPEPALRALLSAAQQIEDEATKVVDFATARAQRERGISP